jgi:hypothetical protein
MSTTRRSASPLETALGAIPASFRSKIIASYIELRRRFAEGRHDSAGMSVGKLCESVLRFLQHHLTGTSAPFGTQIPNLSAECEKLGQTSKTAGPESLRIIIPRALSFMYTVRNKRGIGHIGGDVDANGIDSATMVRVADWVMAELLRVFHNLSLEDAQSLVDSIATRNLPLVWEVGGRRRILAGGLDYKEQVLLLLASAPTAQGVLTEDLVDWTEHSNSTVFKRSVLGALHQARLIEYDRETELVTLSPSGAKHVEDMIIPKLTT